MIYITPAIYIDETELDFAFIRSSGPGGQNVNKVSTAVQLRFDAGTCPSLSDDVRNRLLRLAGHRATDEGVILIEARRFRTQEQNKQDAVDRLVQLIAAAAVPPKPRHKTRPTLASRQRRIETKRHRSEIKRSRGRVADSD